MDFRLKSKILLLSILGVYVLLVSTHKGEFWPFSIYPMFSQAGKTWTRAIVRINVDTRDPVLWKNGSLDELPGQLFAMDQVGINQNDLANFISKNEDWTKRRIQGLRSYFKKPLLSHNFMIYRVQGRLRGKSQDSVEVSYTPYLLLTPDSTIINPKL